MTIAHNKVYLVTSVAHPGHFLTVHPSFGSKIIASPTIVSCWHLKHDTGSDDWTINPISSPLAHQLGYSGADTDGYSLTMAQEDNGSTFVGDSGFKLKMKEVSGNYEISTTKDGTTWLAALGPMYFGQDMYAVQALKRDDTKPGNQQWKFLKMPE